MYLAWKTAGTNPFIFRHSLMPDYTRPGTGELVLPAFPSRVKKLVWGFTLQLDEETARAEAVAARAGGMG